MKAVTWIAIGIGVLVILMILLTVLPQTDLLQTRVDQGIGSGVREY